MIVLVFSIHRLEVLPALAELMEPHPLLLLEEPSVPEFQQMLCQEIPLEEYLQLAQPGFPSFAREQGHQFRRLHQQGKTLIQLDPFFEVMGHIHDFFIAGGKPDQLETGSLRWAVYQAEHQCTAALIQYYTRVATASFEAILASIKHFARCDAARGRLRDRLRVEAIVEVVTERRPSSVYLEAGELHLALVQDLRRRLPQVPLRCCFVRKPLFQRRLGRYRFVAPGDLLTLRYAFQSRFSEQAATLLAARNMIFLHLLHKQEIPPSGEDPFPHTTNEIDAYRLIRHLTTADCAILYPQLRERSPEEAAEIVRHYLSHSR